jgi:hypothetical protein
MFLNEIIVILIALLCLINIINMITVNKCNRADISKLVNSFYDDKKYHNILNIFYKHILKQNSVFGERANILNNSIFSTIKVLYDNNDFNTLEYNLLCEKMKDIILNMMDFNNIEFSEEEEDIIIEQIETIIKIFKEDVNRSAKILSL